MFRLHIQSCPVAISCTQHPWDIVPRQRAFGTARVDVEGGVQRTLRAPSSLPRGDYGLVYGMKSGFCGHLPLSEKKVPIFFLLLS